MFIIEMLLNDYYSKNHGNRKIILYKILMSKYKNNQHVLNERMDFSESIKELLRFQGSIR